MICFQTPNNFVKFQTQDLDYPSILSYYKFLELADNEIHVMNFKNFLEELNKFKVLQINIENRQWEILPTTYEGATFEELLELNQINENQEESLMDNYKRRLSEIQGKPKNGNPIRR